MLKKSLVALFLCVSTLSAINAYADYVLNRGDQLTITTGVPSFDSIGNQTNVTAGSWFGLDLNGNGTINGTEKTALAEGEHGIWIGFTTPAGASHSGYPTAGDSNSIDAPWFLFGNTGSDYTPITPITGTPTALNFSGWTMNWSWNGSPAINLGSGAWGAGFSDGTGNLIWDGLDDHAYSLDYHASVPASDPNFGGVKYALHLEGRVICFDQPCLVYATTVPEASTYDMLLVGLSLVGYVVHRRGKVKLRSYQVWPGDQA